MSRVAIRDRAVILRARRSYRWLRKKAKRASSHVWLAGLRVRNRLSQAKVLGDNDVVVSLTSYGTRVGSVAFAIESIGCQTMRPRRLILWLDNQQAVDNRPASLRRLEQRGLEIKLSENFGPHTKYFPYVQSEARHQSPLVTADDDVLYPPHWLRRLYHAHLASPDIVNCYRAAEVRTDNGTLSSYSTWPMVKSTTAQLNHFATGVSGVIYPVTMLAELAARGSAFMETCPKADDIWLHWVALQAGIPVRQISRIPVHFPVIPGTQDQTLVEENVNQGANDKWIAALYSAADAALLERSTSQSAPR